MLTPSFGQRGLSRKDWSVGKSEGFHPLSLLQHSSGLVFAKSWNFTMMSCHDTFYLKTFHYPNTDSDHKISTKEIDVTFAICQFHWTVMGNFNKKYFCYGIFCWKYFSFCFLTEGLSVRDSKDSSIKCLLYGCKIKTTKKLIII